MLQLFATIRKEFIMLIRDKSGLAIMFVMPIALVTIMALIQDAPFRDYQELKIPTLIINNDKGNLGDKIESELQNSKIFKLYPKLVDEEKARNLVAAGEFDIGILIPANASLRLNTKVQYYVDETLYALGVVDSIKTDTTAVDINSQIIIFFTPGIKPAFKNSVLSGIRQITSGLESEAMLLSFKKELNPDLADSLTTEEEPFGKFIPLKEIPTGGDEQAMRELNSVQHNVPAWTMFGMFFIVISLAGSIIKEREDGSYLRIRTMPGSYMIVLAGKIIGYLTVCILQCVLMLLVGILLLPIFGLPQLIIGNDWLCILIIALSSGLAATGFGVLIGTVFNTHQQAATFGSVSVVILAALGGIWVPVYIMPGMLQTLAEFSPLYWGLNAFQSIFTGEGTLLTVIGYVYKLLLFFALTTIGALLLNKIKNS